jgi:Tfp pilus assembly protein PilN
MIKVNLAGNLRKQPAKAAGKGFALPVSFTPFLLPCLLVAIAVGFTLIGYFWHSNLTNESTELDQQIRVLEDRKAMLEAVIKQDQVYESRRTLLENRVKIIEGLQKNQVSPVMVLDQLADAIQRTQYVWLSSLEQKEAMLSMSGFGTSLSAIADFYSNLNATGYFKNVDLGPSQESSGNFTFSLKCEFSPPRQAEVEVQTVAGGN